MNKKEWEAPKLVVLYKTKLEETVLTYCKVFGSISGPTDAAGQCIGQGDPCTPCDAWTAT